MDPSSDERLVRLSRRGDKAAFENLVEKYVRLAGAAAFAIVGDFHEAADVVQDSFIKVHAALGSLHEPSKFKGWLYGIVRTTALDHLRMKKLKTVSIEAAGEHPGAKQDAPWTRMLVTETQKRVHEVVASLPESYREVVLLKHIENLSYREIAGIIGVTESAVESRLYRARQLLKEQLKDLR